MKFPKGTTEHPINKSGKRRQTEGEEFRGYYLVAIDKRNGTPYLSQELSIKQYRHLQIQRLKRVTLVKHPLPDAVIRYEDKQQFLERINELKDIDENFLTLRSAISQLYNVWIAYIYSEDIYTQSRREKTDFRKALKDISKSASATIMVGEWFSGYREQ